MFTGVLVDMVKMKCEVYSRVVGYIRPLDAWNDSKQAEFHDRLKFDKGQTSLFLKGGI
jgi:hypothetical protein